MPCPVISFELLDVRGPCVEGRMQARFRVTLHEISSGPWVVAHIMTGDFSLGPNEIQVPVYYPDTDNPTAWQDGSAPDTGSRIYDHYYLEGSYPNVRLQFVPIPAFAGCDPVPIVGGDDSGRVNVPPCPEEDPPPPCPEISWAEPSVAESCNSDGLWQTSFSAIVASTAVGGELFWVDGEDITHPLETQTSTVVGETRVLSGSRAFPPGPVKLRAATVCGSASIVFELAACPGQPCPQVVISQPLFGTTCDDEGRRSVAVSASVAFPPPTSGFLHAQLVDGDGDVLDDRSETATAISLSGSRSYSGGPQSFSVRLLSPADCSESEAQITITVPACPVGPVVPDCPDIVIEQLSAEVPPDCVGSCPVNLVMRVSLPPDLDETATIRLSDDGGEIETTTATAGIIVRNLTRGYSGGQHVVRALVSLPSGCTYAAEQPFSVPQSQQPSWWPDWLPVPCPWCCIVWFVINILLLIATAIMIGVTFCFFQWYLLAITIGLAVITFISVVLNLIFCAWQENACAWARWLPRIIVVIGVVAGIIVLVVAIIEAFLSKEAGGIAALPCFLGAIIQFGYFGLLAYITWEILYFFGCNPLSVDDILSFGRRRRG